MLFVEIGKHKLKIVNKVISEIGLIYHTILQANVQNAY